MATSSVSGLVSGLDTASIIDQLMQLETVPQNRLKSQQSSEQTVVAALQSLNTDVALLGSRAGDLAKTSTWQTLKATSSSSDVTATAGPTATATSLSVTVQSLAVAHQVGFAFNATTTAPNVTSTALRLDFGSDPANPTKPPIQLTTDGTLQGLADAINDPAKATGLTATIVRTGADASGTAQYGLVVTANKTGAASQFTLTNDDNGGLPGTHLAAESPQVRQGSDATVSLGSGLTLTSTTNTFTDVTPGVSMTLSASAAIGSTTTVTVAQDSSGVKASVAGLVSQLNTLLGKVDAQSRNASGTGANAVTAGPLAGDPTVRSLRSALVDALYGPDNTSMAQYGIQTDKNGMLVFDGDAFDKAYAADPAGTTAKFATTSTTDPVTGTVTTTKGWTARLQDVATLNSDPNTGTLTSAITGHTSTIDQLGHDIDDWDIRLDLRRTSLQRTYTALETALSSLQSQGNWLAGQIAHLPTSS
ncbi:MAG: flagellar filament capping protein FliD [Nocardioides sp.]